MNFFEHQKRAKQNSIKLVILFTLAVLSVTFVLVYFFCLILPFMEVPEEVERSFSPFFVFKYTSTKYIYQSIFLSMAVIFSASLYRISTLSRNGGRRIAEELRAKEITKNRASIDETTILNIVEEISIASGIPPPPVYLINSSSINAFVAGISYEDAVIGITRGALEKLNREELQGVIAHEYSHMFNGDMKLNLKTVGFLYGILFVSAVGEYIIKSLYDESYSDSPSGILVALGAVLYAIGWIGYFFGSIIKAALSRQREFFADASAVQFTRNPDGIANALKKIGYYSPAKTEKPLSSEFSHFYFSQEASKLFSLATHPPLNERIRRIDRFWDGNFEKYMTRLSIKEKMAKKEAKEKDRVEKMVTVATVLNRVDEIGNIALKQIKEAKKSISIIDDESIREPLEAGFTILYMLLDDNEKIRHSQLDVIGKNYEKFLYVSFISQNLSHVEDFLKSKNREDYVKIMLLCIKALRLMTKDQYKVFKETAEFLILADDHISWFEWNIKYLVFHQLDIHFGFAKVPNETHKNANSIKFEIELFLSALCFAQTKDDQKAKRIFDEVMDKTKTKNLHYIDYENITNRLLTNAIEEIGKGVPLLRKWLLEVAISCLKKENGTFSPLQIESIHAISALLRLPISL